MERAVLTGKYNASTFDNSAIEHRSVTCAKARVGAQGTLPQLRTRGTIVFVRARTVHCRARMPITRVLVTGGAGFIGSHLADELLARGYSVRVLDSLIPQVHGAERQRPSYLAADIELIEGDVRNPDAVRRALVDVDVVYHLAARVGVGQSMYELAEYTSVNNLGTAVL